MTKSSKRRPKDIAEECEIALPPRDYQTTKAELEEEHDIPGAEVRTMRSAFFRRVRVKKEKHDTASTKSESDLDTLR